MDICASVEQNANDFWRTEPVSRARLFAWIMTHALECDSCALLLEERAEELAETRG